jgi:hypothetical protein
MGVDMLDFTFRIEKSFKMKFQRGDYDRLPLRKPPNVTAGELHDWVVQLCKDRGVTVPWSSWNRVKRVLVDVTGKSPKLIRRQTDVVRELGMS